MLSNISNNLLDIAKEHNLNLNKTSVIIALSGGSDSVFLLHALYQIQQEALKKKSQNLKSQDSQLQYEIQAVHINHNISANANFWENYCITLCQQYNIPLKIYSTKIMKTGGDSLENIARQFRYNTFFKYIQELRTKNFDDDPKIDSEFHTDKNIHSNKKQYILAVAHHMDDQLETILSQIFRGSDLHNIAAMRPFYYKTNQQAESFAILRPLLNINKNDILNYLKNHNIKYCIDESNNDSQYLRNFLRNNILPQLYAWDKNIANKLLGMQANIVDYVNLADNIAIEDLKIITLNQHTIDYVKFINLNRLRQENVIKYFILNNNIQLPSTKKIREFVRQVIHSRWDRYPILQLSETQKLTKYKNIIIIR